MACVHRKVLVGIDRLDAVMGIPHKLLAFEALLENHPQYSGRDLYSGRLPWTTPS